MLFSSNIIFTKALSIKKLQYYCALVFTGSSCSLPEVAESRPGRKLWVALGEKSNLGIEPLWFSVSIPSTNLREDGEAVRVHFTQDNKITQ